MNTLVGDLFFAHLTTEAFSANYPDFIPVYSKSTMIAAAVGNKKTNHFLCGRRVLGTKTGKVWITVCFTSVSQWDENHHLSIWKSCELLLCCLTIHHINVFFSFFKQMTVWLIKDNQSDMRSISNVTDVELDLFVIAVRGDLSQCPAIWSRITLTLRWQFN